jgi:uncharacterized protein YdeI (YjbR/CyaY-like superfamily)
MDDLSEGLVHKVPNDLREALMGDESAKEKWQGLTPIARNEWICWTISTKKETTRKNHINRVITELLEGKRRPCCWAGCTHRKFKELSPSVHRILKK